MRPLAAFGLAALLASGGIAALVWWSAARESEPGQAPTLHVPPLPALPGAGDWRERLRGQAERIVVVGAGAKAGATAAPVLQVGVDGALALLTPPPLPRGPVATWDLAAVLVPGTSLGSLPPPARAGLLEALGILAGDAGLVPAALSWQDLAAEPDEVATLLRWRR